MVLLPPRQDGGVGVGCMDNNEQSVDEVLISLIPGSEDGKVSVHDQPEEYQEFVPQVPDELVDLLAI